MPKRIKEKMPDILNGENPAQFVIFCNQGYQE